MTTKFNRRRLLAFLLAAGSAPRYVFTVAAPIRWVRPTGFKIVRTMGIGGAGGRATLGTFITAYGGGGGGNSGERP